MRIFVNGVLTSDGIEELRKQPADGKTKDNFGSTDFGEDAMTYAPVREKIAMMNSLKVYRTRR